MSLSETPGPSHQGQGCFGLGDWAIDGRDPSAPDLNLDVPHVAYIGGCVMRLNARTCGVCRAG